MTLGSGYPPGEDGPARGDNPGYGSPPPGPGPTWGAGAPPPGAPGVPPPGYGGYGPPGGYPPYGGGPGYGYGYGRPPAPEPGIVPLRPLMLGDILDGAFTAIRWNPKTILGSSAIVAAASGVLVTLVTLVLRNDVFTNVVYPSSDTTMTAGQTGTYIGLVSATLGVSSAITIVARTLLTGILTVAIGQGVLGWKETLGSAWQACRSGFWRLVGTLLLKYLLLIGGLILAIGVMAGIGVLIALVAHLAGVGVLIGVIGGITAVVFFVIMTIRWALAIPITMLERTRPLASLGRSWRLVKGSSWRILGISLLTSIIVGIAGAIIEVPFGLAGGGTSVFTAAAQHGAPSVTASIISAIGGIIAQTITSPLTAGVSVLLYADLRMRREGLDIALQAAAASPAGQPGGTVQPGSQPDPRAGGLGTSGGDPRDVWLTGTGSAGQGRARGGAGPWGAPPPGTWPGSPGPGSPGPGSPGPGGPVPPNPGPW